MLAAQQLGNLFADAGKAVVTSIGLVDLFPLVGTEPLVERVGSRQVFAQACSNVADPSLQPVGRLLYRRRSRAWRGEDGSITRFGACRLASSSISRR